MAVVERHWTGGRLVLSVAPAAGGETLGGWAIRVEYCWWGWRDIGRVGVLLWVLLLLLLEDRRRASERFSMSIASTRMGEVGRAFLLLLEASGG